MSCLKSLVFCLCLSVAVVRSEPCTEEGAVKKVKSTEFKCVENQWTPSACLTDNGKRVEDGKVVTTEHRMLQCQKLASNEMTMVALACVSKGHLVLPTQSITSGHVYYTCRASKGSVNLEVAGCIGPNGNRIAAGATVDVDQYVYRCEISHGTASLQPFACIYRGRTVQLNETVTEPDFWRVCRLDDQAGIMLDVAGCVDAGMRLQPDEVFHNAGNIYKCVKLNGTVKVEGVGCLEVTPALRFVEHFIGDTWVESQGKVGYEMQCSSDITGVFKWATRCVFTEDNQVTLAPMCMQKVGDRLYECIRTENQLLTTEVVNPFNLDTILAAKRKGLEFCN